MGRHQQIKDLISAVTPTEKLSDGYDRDNGSGGVYSVIRLGGGEPGIICWGTNPELGGQMSKFGTLAQAIRNRNMIQSNNKSFSYFVVQVDKQ